MRHLFRKYFRSTLSPDEFEEVANCISEKKQESVFFDEIEQLWYKSAEEDELPQPNRVLFQNIKDIIRNDERNTFQRKIKLYSWGLRIAAVLVIGLIASTVFFSLQTPPSEQVLLSEELQTITTPYGAKTNITLPDGSVVWLNSGSKLIYPLRFGDSRPVKLIGEAYFKVEKNKGPFIVSTNFGDIKVKGTSFNVKAYNDDDSFEATLVEGVIAYNTKNSDKEITLKPGEQLERTAERVNIKQVETKYFTSWKEGKLLFNREPFPGFIKKLERWYNVQIEYSDPKLNEIWYTGTIEMESISEVMEMISKAAPVTYSFNNKTRVFTIKAK